MAKEDLIPMSERSKAEAIELGRKGGINSGKTRRKKKAMQEMAEIILGIRPKLTPAMTKQLRAFGIDRDDFTMQTMALMKQNEKAIKGDLAALQFLRDTSGEKPKDNIGLTHEMMGDFEIVITGSEED